MSATLLTSTGPGGVAVIEVRDRAGREGLRELCGSLPPAGRLRLVRPLHRGEVLDEALLVARDGEVFELHVHGSPPLVEELITILDGHPSEVGGLEEALAGALSTEAARILLDQVEGAWERELAELARLEDGPRDELVGQLLERGRIARRLWSPTRIVLAGPVNAGKSTLFNALLGTERVLVSEEAGTTRDAVHERTVFGAWPVELIDTAGERELEQPEGLSHRAVEAQGQARARELGLRADLVLRLAAADGPVPEAIGDEGRVIGLLSRSDRAGGGPVPRGWTPVAALTDPQDARRKVAELMRVRTGLPREPWVAGHAVPVGEAALALCEQLLGQRGGSGVEGLLARLGAESASPTQVPASRAPEASHPGSSPPVPEQG